MRRRALILLFPVLVVCVVVWAARVFPRYLAGVHQRSVIQELAQWESDYSAVASRQEAVRAAEMLEYVQAYYVPSEGYRSTAEIEAELELQRQDTVDSFVASLCEFTGKDFGEDSGRWLSYLGSVGAE